MNFVILVLIISLFYYLMTVSSFTSVGIPKKINKIFIDSTMELPVISDNIQNAINTWTDLNPEYKLQLWSGNDCKKYLLDNFNKEYLDCFNNLIPYSYKCDFIRYCIIYNEGGWYTDWQQKLLIPLDSINNKNYSWISCWDATGDNAYKCMQNGLFASTRHNILLKCCIDKVLENYKNRNIGTNPWVPTGPCLLGDCFIKLKPRNAKIGITKNDPITGPYFDFDNKKAIINKCCIDIQIPGTNYTNGNNYMELWNAKNIYL